MNRLITILVLFSAFLGLLIYAPPSFSIAQEIINVQDVLIRKNINIFVEPSVQTLIEGSVFDVYFYINTNGSNINTIELNVKFSHDKLTMISPSGSKSLFGIWLEPPSIQMLTARPDSWA